MLKNLSNNLIEEFFMDCTYSAVPPSIYKYKLMVLCGYEKNIKKTLLCCFILLINENVDTFENIYKYLLEKYDFNPRNIMVDFNHSQIVAINNIFKNALIHGCFFHFSQAIWRRFRKYGLCKKGSYEQNSELLFNIQLMAFMDRKKIDNFYKKFTKKYKEEKFKNFFSYFRRNWMGERIPIRIWNFYDIISKESIDERFYYTNNLTENINRYLNSNLKSSRCSKNIFKEAILNIISQFEVKVSNELNNKKKQIY